MKYDAAVHWNIAALSLGWSPGTHLFIYIGWAPFITLLINAARQEGVKDFLLHPGNFHGNLLSQKEPQLLEASGAWHRAELAKATRPNLQMNFWGLCGWWPGGFGQVGMLWVIAIPGWNSCHFRLSPSGCSWGELWPGRGDTKMFLMLLKAGEELQKEVSIVCIHFLLSLRSCLGAELAAVPWLGVPRLWEQGLLSSKIQNLKWRPSSAKRLTW